MTHLELAKKTLKGICDDSFSCSLNASEGGACGNGWADDVEFDLSSEEILYLLKERLNNEELFEDIITEEIDIEERIGDMAEEESWPEGISTRVNDIIPDELSDLSQELEALDPDDVDAAKAIREKLMLVSDGEYTFYFTVESDGYYFSENEDKSVELTAKEALGLLYHKYGKDKAIVFEGICDESFDEDLINDKVEVTEMADDYDDSYSYGGECEQLNAYLDAWEYIINHILSGDITEETLGSWLEYFNDSENYEMEISDWFEDREEDL